MSKIDDIHQLIDTRIRQKTADGSIQKTDVADALDAIVDALLVAIPPITQGRKLIGYATIQITDTDAWVGDEEGWHFLPENFIFSVQTNTLPCNFEYSYVIVPGTENYYVITAKNADGTPYNFLPQDVNIYFTATWGNGIINVEKSENQLKIKQQLLSQTSWTGALINSDFKIEIYEPVTA